MEREEEREEEDGTKKSEEASRTRACPVLEGPCQLPSLKEG